MLKNSLPEIKGRLLHYFFEIHSGMNTWQDEDGKAKINYEEFYIESKNCIEEIMAINSVSDLDRFCEEWGLNELDSEFDLSFYNLANEYLKPKYEPRQQREICEGVSETETNAAG